MDVFIQSYKNNAQEPILDFEITGKGELSLLFGEDEIRQRALVASFTQRGTIPQLPNTGVEWAEMIASSVPPAEINSQIIQQIHECAETYTYSPKYSALNGELIVTIS